MPTKCYLAEWARFEIASSMSKYKIVCKSPVFYNGKAEVEQ